MKTKLNKLPINKKCSCCHELIYEAMTYEVFDGNVWYNCPNCSSTGFLPRDKWVIYNEHLSNLQTRLDDLV